MNAAGTLLETFLTLVLVCAVAVVMLWLARRAGVARAFGAAELVGQLPLEPRRAVYLVRIGARVLVVGASEAGLTKLSELDASDVPLHHNAPRNFSDVLKKALARGQDAPPSNDQPS